MKISLGKKGVIAIVLAIAMIALSTSSAVAALATNDWVFSNDTDLQKVDMGSGAEVLDYTASRPDITGEKLVPADMEFAEKSWFEYAEYESIAYTSGTDGENYYEIYMPTDLSKNTIMALRDYQPEGVSPQTTIGVLWFDVIPMMEMIAAGNLGVIASGGITQGLTGLVSEAVIAGTVFGAMTIDTMCNSFLYYKDQLSTGIPGDDEWPGISQDGFYASSSLTISKTASSSFTVAKTNTMSSKMTASGGLSFSAEEEIKAGIPLLAEGKIKLKEGIEGKFSSEFSYGINYQQSQQSSHSETISRTFNARTDEEVKNVPWKLCEYCARIPLKMIQYNNQSEKKPLNEVYIYYNYLYGVCRVFANGYIEHWNTGELVSYADFFDGFVTAGQSIDNYKKQAKENARG